MPELINERAIAVENRQPVVRCENCGNKERWERAGDVICGIDGMPHKPDRFCAYWEHKIGGEIEWMKKI